MPAWSKAGCPPPESSRAAGHVAAPPAEVGNTMVMARRSVEMRGRAAKIDPP
jgi:hypothetical protein